MRYGFVKVAAATPKIRVADPAYNAQRILARMREAQAAGAEVIVFPELCVSGYTCGDLFGQEVLLRASLEALKTIAAGTSGGGMLAFVGVPYRMGGVLYNCAAALCGGKVLALIPKRHLPNYAEFYEKRNFGAYTGENRTVFVRGRGPVREQNHFPFGRRSRFYRSRGIV